MTVTVVVALGDVLRLGESVRVGVKDLEAVGSRVAVGVQLTLFEPLPVLDMVA